MKAIQYEYSIPWLATGRIARMLRLKGYLSEYGF